MITLSKLLEQQFNRVVSADEAADMHVGSFSEWDSMSHFSFLVLIEETYNVQFTVEEMSELKSILSVKQSLNSKGIDVAI